MWDSAHYIDERAPSKLDTQPARHRRSAERLRSVKRHRIAARLCQASGKHHSSLGTSPSTFDQPLGAALIATFGWLALAEARVSEK